MNGVTARLAILVSALAAGVAACDGTGTTVPGESCTVAPGELLITEFMAAPTKSPEDGSPDPIEWFEIHNPTSRRLALAGLVLEAGPVTKPRTLKVLEALDPGIEPGAYLVVATGTLDDGFTDVAWPTGTGILSNTTASTITLRCGEEIVDRVAYGAEVAGPALPRPGQSWQLSSRVLPTSGEAADPAVNDTPDAWCLPAEDATHGDMGDLGTPGEPNRACDAAGECLDGDVARPAVPPLPGDLVITEVFTNSRSGTTDTDSKLKEWVEVHAIKDVDLVGLSLWHQNGTSPELKPRKFKIEGTNCVRLAGGTWGILAGSGDAAVNGGLPAVLFGFPGGMDLYRGNNDDGAATVSIVDADENVLTSAAHPGCPSGVSVSLDAAYGSNPDAATEPGNWCESEAAGQFDGLGTPGTPNPSCPTSL